MRQVPERCESSKCKATEIQFVDAWLQTSTEYRETYECLVCGRQWDNVYKYKKTVRRKADEL